MASIEEGHRGKEHLTGAAERMGVSCGHDKRLKGICVRDEPRGVVHGNRGLLWFKPKGPEQYVIPIEAEKSHGTLNLLYVIPIEAEKSHCTLDLLYVIPTGVEGSHCTLDLLYVIPTGVEGSHCTPVRLDLTAPRVVEQCGDRFVPGLWL